MASWKFGIGNLVSRAASYPVAVAPAVADTLLPLANLGSGYPDEQGGLQWRDDGAYDLDFDLNLLVASSDRADAPTGWLDLLNYLAGTPGLPANPPDWGNYDGRNPALRFYRPVVQEIDVMPGEQVRLEFGIEWPSAAAGATGVQVRVVDLSTGKAWDGVYNTWTDDGIVAEQTVGDAWLAVAETIDADPNRTERTIYLVILEPIAAGYGATTYCYASANGAAGSPALFAELDTVAVIGHNLPDDAVVTLVPSAGTTLTLAPAQPSMFVTGVAAQLVQTWRLSVQMPTGNQPRPVLGEVWIGKARTMLVGSPIPTFGGEESAPGQLTLEGPRKRKEILADDARPVHEFALSFRAATDAAFRQVRDEVMRLTRFGADPLVLMPGDLFEGTGRIYHGRIEDRLAWTIITPTAGGSARTFAVPFTESPFAAP